MTQHLTVDSTSPAPTTATARTRALLTCGVLAGPLFVGITAVQVLTRDGFDLTHHPISLLSLGEWGWVQIANFVLAGLLSVACAVGSRRVLGTSRAGTWGPRLLGAYGVGLIAGGVFVADPALGFPPGTPDGIPDTISWHAALHGAAPALAFLSLILACGVFARHFTASGQRGLALYSVITGLTCLVLSAWPGVDGASVRLAVAAVLGFAWLTALARRLRGAAPGLQP